MIFYFSATGNSRHAAHRIAESIGDRAILVTDCLKNEKFNFIAHPDEKIGFVCPVYSLGLPVTVTDFIKGLTSNTAITIFLPALPSAVFPAEQQKC